MNEYIADPAKARCILCSNDVDKNEMICMEGRWICSTCKPAFLQMIQEGASMADFTVARQKKTLVAGKKAALPDRCIKCNAPANGQRLKRNLYWHSAVIYLLILISILLYALVAVFVRKRATINIGLCDLHRSRRRINMAISWSIFLFSLIMMFGGFASNMAGLGVTGIALLIGSIIYGAITVPMVRAVKIDKEYAWVRGAGREYLDSLPEWVKPGK